MIDQSIKLQSKIDKILEGKPYGAVLYHVDMSDRQIISAVRSHLKKVRGILENE